MNRLVTPLLVTVALLIPAVPAHGQTPFHATFGVTRLSPDLGADLAPHMLWERRFSFGLARDIPLSERLSLRLGGRMVKGGGRFEGGPLDGEELRISHFELTALGNVQFPLLGGRVSARLMTGPALGLGNRCKVTAKAALRNSTSKWSLGCHEAIGLTSSTFDFGWAAGVGLEVRLFDNFPVTFYFGRTWGLMEFERNR